MEQLQLPYVATEVAASATPATATIKSAKRKRVQRARAAKKRSRVCGRCRFAECACLKELRPESQRSSWEPDAIIDSAEFADRGALCAMSWSELDAAALEAGREALLHVLTWRARVLSRGQAPARRPSGPHHTAAPRSAKPAGSVASWQQAAKGGTGFEIAIIDARTAAQVVRWRMSEAVRAMTEAPPIAAAVRGALLEVLRARARELTAARPWRLEKTEVPSGAAE